MNKKLGLMLGKIPIHVLVTAAIVLGLAPFKPRPHLFEKTEMLIHGELVRMIDIFDFALHGSPILLLTLGLILRSHQTTHK